MKALQCAELANPSRPDGPTLSHYRFLTPQSRPSAWNLRSQVAHKKFSAAATTIVERLPPEQLTTVRANTRGMPVLLVVSKAQPAVSLLGGDCFLSAERDEFVAIVL